MSARIERIMKAYPEMVMERNCLAHQIAHFKGVTAAEVISSMYTPRVDGDRVQSSGTSDKTAQIALTYQDRVDQINREWFEHLETRMRELTEEMRFFESTLHALSCRLSSIMWDMVVNQMTCDAVEKKYFLSHTSLYRQRQKAISEMERMYSRHEEEMSQFLLQ